MNTSIPQNQHAFALALTQPLGAQIPLQQLETPRPQGCRKCRATFSEGAEQRNYSNFATYGFETRAAFEKHSARNGRCPCKQATEGAGGGATPTQGVTVSPPVDHLQIWSPYKDRRAENELDYVDDLQVRQITLDKYMRKIFSGEEKPLWFPTTETTALSIVAQTLDPSIQWISLVAQPGSGKTMVIHRCIYLLITHLPLPVSRHPDNITLTTGMSDVSWYKQTLDNMTLHDGTSKDYLWKSLNDIKNNHCLVHRANLHKRITYLRQNIDLMSNHVFIIDESHFADSDGMSISLQLNKLGLTSERMRSYNIKVILISATPDVTLSMMSERDNHKQVVLRQGEGYKGFKYYNEEGMISDYNTSLPTVHNLDELIMSRWFVTAMALLPSKREE